MDDQTFDDPNVAQEWINIIEGEKSRIRDLDIYPQLNKWLNFVSPNEILEIGSGQGICSDKIDLNNRKYTGVEPSPLLLARANELYAGKNMRFVNGNAYDLPFSENVFDAVFSIAVWHLLRDLQKAANELSRILKKDAHFLIITANPGAYELWTKAYSVSKLEGRRFEGRVLNKDNLVSQDVLYLHTLDEIIGSLKIAGLIVQETETFRESLISIQGQKL